MPATASRFQPSALSLRDDCTRSPPSYASKHASLPSPKPAPAPSPRTEKKPPLTPPPEADPKKLDKPDRRTDQSSDSRPEPPSDSRAHSNDTDNEKLQQEQEEQTPKVAPSNPIIDCEVFSQILDLDEDDTYEFSQQMVEEFFSQAEDTFDVMDGLYKSRKLVELSDKGHYLKGSSAAIGITRVRQSCEEIQNFGRLQGQDEKPITIEDALVRLAEVLARVRGEYKEAKYWLDQWFKDPDFRLKHEIA